MGVTVSAIALLHAAHRMLMSAVDVETNEDKDDTMYKLSY